MQSQTHQGEASADPGKPLPQSTFVRLRGCAVALACMSVLIVGWRLSPRESFGTHEQLNIPPCSVLVQTGYPCPTCGLTTSISAMTHGRWKTAFLAQPFGVVLFCAMLFFFGAGLAEAASGRSVLGSLGRLRWWVLAMASGFFAGWGAKILFGTLSGELPLR